MSWVGISLDPCSEIVHAWLCYKEVNFVNLLTKINFECGFLNRYTCDHVEPMIIC